MNSRLFSTRSNYEGAWTLLDDLDAGFGDFDSGPFI
jgi:hypothetical protein